MNWDRIQGNWKQIAGKRDKLAGKLQERYGIAKDEAEKQLNAWETRMNEAWSDERARR